MTFVYVTQSYWMNLWFCHTKYMSETLTSESGSSFKDRVEQIIAVMLGLAAIITAWTAFQSSQLGDKVQESFSEGIRSSDMASQEYNTAIATDEKATKL